MKYLSIFFVALLSSWAGYGQTTAAAYNFTATTGTYASISGTGTAVASTFLADDVMLTSIPIGFSFSFCGVTYTNVSACSNGWISLSNASATAAVGRNNTTANATTIGAGFLFAFWDDLNGAGDGAYYQTSGTSPNRVFTFEFANWGSFTGSGNCNMQVKLYENGNVIEYWYGTSTYASHTGSIGISNSGTDYQVLPSSAASPTPSSTTFTTNIATSPANGTVYRWYGCPVTVTAASSAAVCPGGTVTLTGTTTGTGYSWAGPGGYTSTALSPVINGITAAGIYTFTATNGSCSVSATANVGLLSAPPAPVVTPSVATICNGNTVTLTATLPPAAINLIPNQGWETGVPTVPGTPVAGWNTTAISAAHLTQVSAGIYPAVAPHSGSYLAAFHSWSYGTGTNVTLISPSFSMSGITGGQITFWMYRDAGYNTATYDLEGLTVYMNTTASVAGATTLGYVPRRMGGVTTGSVTGTSSPGTAGWYQYTCAIPAGFSGGTNYLLLYFYSRFGNDIHTDDISITGLQALAPPVWTPITDLYRTPTFSTPYAAGDTLLTVYMHPTSTVTSTTTSYIATITNGVCTSSDTAVITVDPGVPAITGASSICLGTSGTLSNPIAGGTWSASNNTVATVNPTTGVVSGLSAGIDTIYYTVPGGCSAFFVVTITTFSTPTTGNTIICNGGFTSVLANSTPGGSWTTSDATVAAVSTTGTVTSGVAGTAVITYTMPSGCNDTSLINVLPPPTAITGLAEVCYDGGTTVLASTPSGGTWTSSNPSVASVDATTGVVTGYTGGAPTITYTYIPGCFATTPMLMKAKPSPIAGILEVCEAGSVTTLSNTDPGGVWTAMGMSASIDSNTGALTGVTAGTEIVTYTISNSCYTTAAVLVNPLPAALTGIFEVCQTDVTTLASTSTGGTWTSGDMTIATVNAGGGVGGITSGIASITYTLPTGCKTAANVQVDQIPAAITGNSYVCNGFTSLLSDFTPGGTWSSSNTTVATTNATGTIYGASVGSVTITYTTGPGSCYAAKPITVSPIAPPTVAISASTGTTICAGTPVTFNSTVIDGGTSPLYVWSINNVISSNATTYSYTPANGDVVRLWVLSSYACSVPDTSSAVLTMTVNPIVTPSISLSTGMGDTVCTGMTTVIYALPVAGGSAPIYQWFVNTVPVSSGSSYSYMPNNGDVVTVNMSSSAPCRTTTAVSATKVLTVSPYVTPLVSLNSSMGPVMCEGYPDVFTASQINGGTAPAYQWAVNGVNTTTGPVFSYAPANGDDVSVMLTSSFPCVSTPTAFSHFIPTVLPVTQPIGVVYADPGYIIPAGVMATFTCSILSGGGTAPTYQWLKNNIPLAGETDSIYRTNVLSTGDSISCQVTNTDDCSGVSIFNYVVVTIGSNVGVNNVGTIGSLVLAPNPNKGTFTIKGNLGITTNEETSLEVTDMLGQVVYRQQVSANGGLLNEQVMLPVNIASGMYLLNVQSRSAKQTFHFTVN